MYRVDQKEEQLQFGLGTIQTFVQLVEMTASYWDAAALAIVAGTLAIVAGMMLLAEWLALPHNDLIGRSMLAGADLTASGLQFETAPIGSINLHLCIDCTCTFTTFQCTIQPPTATGHYRTTPY
jgi:hypothetical protein